MNGFLTTSLLLLLLGVHVENDSFPICTKSAETKELAGLDIEIVVGSIFGEDFSAIVTSEELIYGLVFDEVLGDYVEKEKQSLSWLEWQKIKGQTVLVVPMLQKISVTETPTAYSEEEGEYIEELDGPNYSRLSLTWNSNNDYEVFSYYWPANAEMQTLLELLTDIIISK